MGVALYLPVAAPGHFTAFVFLLAAVVVVGTWAAEICGEIYGEHDSGRITVDEIAGMLVTLASFPATIPWLAAAFFVFRFFDVLKPFPIGRIDRQWRSAGGVMVDDLLAGLYANLTLQIVRQAWPHLA